MNDILNQVSPLQSMLNDLIQFIPKLIVAIIIFLLTLYAARLGARLVRRALERRQVDPELELLLARSARITIIVLGTIWALATVEFDVTGFVAGLGILGFTVGFALKDIAENFVAGILLLVQQPFDIGEVVEVGGYTGTVTSIEVRSTTIRTLDGLLVIIPNADVYSNPITNFSRVEQRRLTIEVGVGYETDLDQATDILLQEAQQLPGVMEDPAPRVVFKEFADSSINTTLYFWIDTAAADYLGTMDAVVKRIKAAFERDGINIPYPIRTLHLPQPLPQPADRNGSSA